MSERRLYRTDLSDARWTWIEPVIVAWKAAHPHGQRSPGPVHKLDGASTTVAALAEAEPLLDLPTRPFPAESEQTRAVRPQGLVSCAGIHYSVPPGLPGAHVTVRIRLGEDDLHMVTTGRAVIAHHRRAPDGAGQTIRNAGHVIALERAGLASFSDKAPSRTKVRRPPPATAQAETEKLRGRPESDIANRVVIDLSHYTAVADRLRQAPHPRRRGARG